MADPNLSWVPEPRSPTVLSVDDVGLTWPGVAKPVLDGINLEVGAGEAAWIRGRNGVGKTTMIRIVAGLLRPHRGLVLVDDLNLERDRRDYQRRLGYLSAGDRGLYARLTARRHLDYCARLAFIPKRDRLEAVDAVAGTFELGELMERRVDRMSQGQRQRIRLALTFLHRPRLVLLDEPLNSLDEEGVALLMQAIDQHRKAGGGCVWVSPGGDSEAMTFSERLRLIDGRLEGDL